MNLPDRYQLELLYILYIQYIYGNKRKKSVMVISDIITTVQNLSAAIENSALGFLIARKGVEIFNQSYKVYGM